MARRSRVRERRCASSPPTRFAQEPPSFGHLWGIGKAARIPRAATSSTGARTTRASEANSTSIRRVRGSARLRGSGDEDTRAPHSHSRPWWLRYADRVRTGGGTRSVVRQRLNDVAGAWLHAAMTRWCYNSEERLRRSPAEAGERGTALAVLRRLRGTRRCLRPAPAP